MYEFVCRVRVTENVWQWYQVVAVDMQEASEFAVMAHSQNSGHFFGPTPQVSVIQLGPKHVLAMNPVPMPDLQMGR